MDFPLQLTRRVRITRGPILLGQGIVGPAAIYLGWRQIYRIDTQDLRIVWSRNYVPFGPFLFFADVLFCGNGFNKLIALDPASGDTLWSRDSWGGRLWDGQLIVFEQNGVLVIEPSTGKVVNRLELPEGSVVNDIKGDVLLLTNEEQTSLAGAYNLRERQLLWQKPLVAETINQFKAPGDSVTLRAGTIAFTVTKPEVGIFGCSMEDGRILWYQPAFVPRDAPIAVNGRVYVLTQGLVPTLEEPAKFMCFDELSGEKIYETEHKQFQAYRPSRPTLVEDNVAFGNQGGFVFAFRLSDGELVWCYRTNSQTYQPAMADNRLYVTSDDGHLLVFEGRKSRSEEQTR